MGGVEKRSVHEGRMKGRDEGEREQIDAIPIGLFIALITKHNFIPKEEL